MAMVQVYNEQAHTLLINTLSIFIRFDLKSMSLSVCVWI